MNKYEAFLSEQKETIDRAENLTCITRATILQDAMILTLDALLGDVETLKKIAIDNQNEDEANAFLSIRCALNHPLTHKFYLPLTA